MEAERPDDSDTYDDRTLLDIIAERFSQDRDPISRRDAAWLVSLAEVAVSRKRVGPLRVNCCSCRAPNCVCLMMVPHENVCDLCANNSHITGDMVHFTTMGNGSRFVTPCPDGCEDHT